MKRLQNYISLIELLRIGLISGRDLHSILSWAEVHFPSKEIKGFLKSILSEMRLESSSYALERIKEEAPTLEKKIFLEILGLQSQSQTCVTSALEDCSELFRDLYRMGQLKSRLFAVPLFQLVSCLIFALTFVGVLPFIWPQVFKSFVLIDRWDLFLFGLIPLGLGGLAIVYLYRRSKQSLLKEMNFIPFLSYAGLHLRSGQEMESALALSIASLDQSFCPSILKFELQNRIRTFEERLEALIPHMNEVWSRFLLGVLWSSRTGRGGLDFIQKTKELEAERIFSQAELRLKADAFLSLVPLVIFCFPSILYLILGPHFYELYLSWGTLN